MILSITKARQVSGLSRAVGLFLAIGLLAGAGQAFAQATYDSPEKAAEALFTAAKARDASAIDQIFGPGTKEWILSGDSVQDQGAMDRFAAEYQQKLSFEKTKEGAVVLVVGTDEFPFPFPIVRKGAGWAFDAALGKEELLNRRIGRNETNAVEVLEAIAEAQREYASEDRDGSGVLQYAQKIRSSAGKRDGLYWPTTEGEPDSPLGPLVAEAAREGYGAVVRSAAVAPYHGYYYRILTAQGEQAPGGAMNYIANGRMIGGYAIIAYPAKYDVSGVMTFIMRQDGVVFEKDLGPDTANAVQRIKVFNPDSSWKKS